VLYVLCRTAGVNSCHGEVCVESRGDDVVNKTYSSPAPRSSMQNHSVKTSASWHVNDPQRTKTVDSAKHALDDVLLNHKKSFMHPSLVVQETECSTHCSDVAADADWVSGFDQSLSLAGAARSFTSHTRGKLPSRLPSDVSESIVVDECPLKMSSELSVGSSGQQSGETGVLNDRLQTRKPTEPRQGRGRGLLSFRQLQTAQSVSETAVGKASGSTEVCDGMIYRAASPPGVTVKSSEGVGGVVDASSKSAHCSESSAVHADHVNSTAPGFTPLVPGSCAMPLTSYHPQVMPYSWPPPVCGIVPPGFASPAVPVVGQTLPMPYSSLPMYPAYGYPVMPGSWPVFPSSLVSSRVEENANDTTMDRVD